MEKNISLAQNAVYVRLVALWVFSESFLGGIIHALKIPVSGLVVGGMAIFTICLIARFVPGKNNVLKATLVVAIFKMMLSPHAPPTAYIAFFFQGICGEYLLRSKNRFKIVCIPFCVLCMLESAAQRILILTLIYGVELWEAVDQFVVKVTHRPTLDSFSFILAAGYLLLHVGMGLGIGFLVTRLIGRYQSGEFDSYRLTFPQNADIEISPQPKRNDFRLLTWCVWIFLVALTIQSFPMPANAWVPKGKVTGILMRGLIILTTWYLIVGPLVKYFLFRFLKNKEQETLPMLRAVTEALPAIKSLVLHSWKTARQEVGGLKRFSFFSKVLLVNILAAENTGN